MRSEVVTPQSRTPKIIKFYYLLKIKEMDSHNNASMGTSLGSGALFAEPPTFLHGLCGIIISHHAKIGKNCTIFQHVTVSERYEKAATIGDNCTIYAGAVIIGDVKIGDNVIVGANCVVVKDIPSNCTAVGVPARLIYH